MRSLSAVVWLAGLFGDGRSWIYVAIAAATLLFAFEVICIAVLIQKMVRAGKQKKEEGEDRSSFALLFAGDALLGALSAQTVLQVLLILSAVGAAALAILLIVARIKGYDFASSALCREEDERLRREKAEQERITRENAERAAEAFAAEQQRREQARAEGAE